MTSVLNSATSAAHHAKKAEKLSHSKESGPDTPGADGEFGALFGAMMGRLEGQDLAAPEGKASPPLVGLAAQVLGPAVHIITASTPALSDDSLYAFARSQGMDENALSLIFQKPVPALVSDLALTSDIQTPGINTPDIQTPDTLSPQGPGLQSASDKLAGSLTPEEKAIASVLSQPVSDKAPKTESLDLGDDASLRWTLGKAADTLQTAQPANQSTFFGLNGLRNFMPTTPPAQTAPTDAAANPESAHQNLAASLILGASEAAQFARRLEMKQTSQRAERVAPGWLPPTGADTGPRLTSVAMLMTEDAQIATLETLAINADLSPEDLSQLLSGRPNGGEGKLHSTTENGSAANTNAAPRPDQAQRTEQYERLSQRLGEALGQRLAAQIAKGDWRVDLALKPYELGNIDIELSMKDGTLQASFSAGQALTRELIADSLPRLKEILSQLGMDVAKMDVNVRQDSQTGGNPTPGRSSSGSGSQAGKGEKEKVGEVFTSMTTRSIDKGPDGLDVLV